MVGKKILINSIEKLTDLGKFGQLLLTSLYLGKLTDLGDFGQLSLKNSDWETDGFRGVWIIVVKNSTSLCLEKSTDLGEFGQLSVKKFLSIGLRNWQIWGSLKNNR